MNDHSSFMSHVHSLYRWVLCPFTMDGERIVPICASYCQNWAFAAVIKDKVMCYCQLEPVQLEAIQEDPEIIVFDSVHLHDRNIHPKAAAHLAEHGVTPRHNTAQMLQALCDSKLHPWFHLKN